MKIVHFQCRLLRNRIRDTPYIAVAPKNYAIENFDFSITVSV